MVRHLFSVLQNFKGKGKEGHKEGLLLSRREADVWTAIPMRRDTSMGEIIENKALSLVTKSMAQCK